MKRYIITNIIPIKGRKVEIYTQKVIDKYGEQFFLNFINTNNSFEQELLYKNI